jgi:glycosyltransferase involved in cell wall biosynthesis
LIFRQKLLILVNWQEKGKWLFIHFLKKKVQHVDIVQPVSLKHTSNSHFTYISNYLSEFYLPIIALMRRNHYDVIVSWQMRIGVCYGILKRIIHVNKPPIHILQDFHIDLTQTRWLYRFRIVLLKLAIPGIDYFCCTSTEEEAIYSRMFGISRNRIQFLPLVESQPSFANPGCCGQNYIFSYGKSDRDFDTLIRAAARLNIQTYILSAKYIPRVQVPNNVCIIRDFISNNDLIQRITSSRIVVLPLKDYRISAGQISMLEVMALARPLIITMNMATKEYAIHRQTALFYSAGDDMELAGHIRYLWDQPEVAERIGQKARESIMILNENRTAVFSNLLERCAMDNRKGVNQ